MGVPPGRERWFFTQIFDANVVSAEQRALTVHHHKLTVIAEIELEAINKTARGERMDFNAVSVQLISIVTPQCMAADTVIKKINTHALRRYVKEQRLQFAAKAVVTYQ